MPDQINRKSLFSEQIFKAYNDCFNRIEAPAKTILLKEGEVARKMYLIEKGCVRVWLNNNGKDITCQFFFENETVSSIESFRKDIPSQISIETIEPCIIWWIDKAELKRIVGEIQEQPEWRSMLIDALFERTFDYIKYFCNFIRDTPEQRYLQLLNDRPEIMQRVPQYYVASYLGISSVHLSRIKNKIARK